MSRTHGLSAMRRPLLPLLLLIVCCLTCSAGNTEFAQVPQAVFPGRAPVNRALSLQQQTQILKDIQHRFTPLQLPASTQQGPLLYSQQSTFPGEPPSPAASAAPSQQPSLSPTPQQVFPTAQQTLATAQQTFAANTQSAPQQVFVPSNGVPLQFYSSLPQPGGTFSITPQQSKFSVEAAQNAPPPPAARVAPTDSSNRVRLLHSEGAGEQVFLQSDRQQLFQQIKDYSGGSDVAETRSAGAEPTLQPQASSFRPTPAATQASSFTPTLTSVQREEQRRQPLQTLLQEQPSRSQIPQTTSTPRPQLYTSPSPAPEHQKKAVEQLQTQFQTQLQQRQELIRKLKLAIANAEVPITADRSQVEPKPGSSGSPPPVIYLANGNKLQLVNSADEAALADPSKLEIKKGPSGTPPPVIYLSNGNKLQLVSSPEEAALLQSSIQSTTPTPVTTPPPPTVSFEELTKGVLPPGAQFEVIRHKQDGGLEEVGNLPPTLPQKKVTFVFLEEQPDGTLKVQGVKGNTGNAQNDGQSSPPDVDQIIKKLQQGELKLPPSNKQPEVPQFLPSPGTTPQESSPSATYISSKPSIQNARPTVPKNTVIPSQVKEQQFTPTDGIANQVSYQYFNIQPSRGTQSFSSISFSPSVDSQASPSAYPEIEATNQFGSTPTIPTPVAPGLARQNSPTIQAPTDASAESVFVSASSSQTASPIRNQFVDFDAKRQKTPRFRVATTTSTTSAPLTYRPQISYRRTTPASVRVPSLQNSRKESPILYRPRYRSTTPATTSTTAVYSTQSSTPFEDHTVALLNQVNGQETVQKQSVKSHHVPPVSRNATKSLYESPSFLRNAAEATSQESVYQQTSQNQTLSDVLRASGLYAMARFLKESSLDSILNDTGPYTLFAPTDKAFEALLVQLGGPDRAAEKFQENPRLLSGLLLHHVVPGAFPLESLQDEMTGVSLAGTQLRVNTYTTQDEQWNDVKVTTINGARVLSQQHDVPVPQGVLHAVDRVMFPLPVGDALQTLLADRERRFESFLRAVRTSGLAPVLSGSKTHTVFAPTERAFARLSAAKRARLLSDPEAARLLVSRHVVRGALYSAGLRYYQLRDALAPDSALTLTVNAAGQLKVNSVLVVTQNIPTTNGVIHAIDSLL
ncbi:proteoglycan 4 [Schistocerca piceifrons]|uniref:proteoglycan 4 n=1 Tax=Schistocerca piceifrons TaxID=274613 RepID=UPI001F5EDCBC|nr:proteoglycan 4 [Schistocerca piceifrons]